MVNFINFELFLNYLSCRKTKVFYLFLLKHLVKFYLILLYFFKTMFIKHSSLNLSLFFVELFFFNLFYFYWDSNNLKIFFFKDLCNVKGKIYIYYNFFDFLKKFLKKVYYNFFDLNLYIRNSGSLLKLLTFLKKDQLFYLDSFIDLLAVDNLSANKRFLLFYNFLSLKNCSRLNLLLYLKDFEKMYSISFLYSSALWLEREVWDLSGIYFLNHKDLRRILTDYGFQGHPLRRDFPLTGFFELYYNYSFKKIIYEPVSLAQKYRNFQFENKWS